MGLIIGASVAVAVLAGAALLVPDAAQPSHEPPSLPVIAASPSLQASASVPPSSSVAPSQGAGSAPPSGAAANFHVGQPAPALVVPQVGGGTIDLAKLKGKPVWINFMATWCPPCRDEFPLMNGFAARYGGRGLVVLAVDVKEDEGIVASFAQSLNTTFPVGLDADGAAQQRWGAVVLPVHFWVDAQGIVRDGSLGGIGPDVMARGLESILPGVTVTP